MSSLDDHELGVLLERQTLEEFCDAQSAQRDHLDLELQQFSVNVREAVMKSCEDTLYNFLHKAGFNVKVCVSTIIDSVVNFARICRNTIGNISNIDASFPLLSGFHTRRSEGIAYENNGGGKPVRDIVYRTGGHENTMPETGEIHEGKCKLVAHSLGLTKMPSS